MQVAWDIHNVLGQKQSGTKLKAFLSCPFAILSTKITGHPAWKEVNKAAKLEDISGEAYYQIFLKHNQKDLAKMAQKSANRYAPQKGIEQIVHGINQQGITQRLASNIGPQFLQNLKTRFKNKYKSSIFDIIKDGKVVDYSTYSTNPNGALPAHITAIPKPHYEFFTEYAKTYGNDGLIIFIDDNIKNIQMAAQAGWIAIHFDITSKKSNPVTQLKADLQTLGFIL